MATVDGVTTAPDKYGYIQGNGGAVDKMSGGSTGDTLQGHALFNQYYGGGGNDSFNLNEKFGQETAAPSKDFGTLAAYITDFHGAGGPGTGEQDFLHLNGFGAGATLDLIGSSTGQSAGSVVYYYSVHDTVKDAYYNIAINSMNGKALEAGDYNFY